MKEIKTNGKMFFSHAFQEARERRDSSHDGREAGHKWIHNAERTFT